MISTGSSLREVVSGPAGNKHLPTLILDTQFDTQSQADLNRALGEALSNENLNQTTQDMRNPSNFGYIDDLERKHRFLVKRVNELSEYVTQPLVKHDTGNDFFVGLNSAWRNSMSFLNNLAKDNLAKLERVLNLSKPAEA